MAGKKKVQFFSDFTGGLNLNREVQTLALNESPDLLNVDLLPHGGFAMRRGVTIISNHTNLQAVASGSLDADGPYILGQVSLGTDALIGISNASRLWMWDGATFTHVATAVTDSVSEFVTHATYNNKLYLANCWNTGVLVARRRTGASFETATTLGNAWNNDYTAPAAGNMPLARLVCNHRGHMWVADTVESSTRYRHRLRFSHPLQPEDWAEADYLDIDNSDSSDAIVALVSFKDRLIVFKRRSVWAVFGYDRDSFVVEQIAGAVGTLSQSSVTFSEQNLFWFSPDGNVYAYNGSQVARIGDNIARFYRRTGWSSDLRVSMNWGDERLWMTTTEAGSPICGTLIFDPSIGKKGSWTQYNYVAYSMGTFQPVGEGQRVFALLSGGLFLLNDEFQEQDEFSVGVFTPIDATFSTAWFSGGDTALKKSFKRLHMTAASKSAGNMLVDVYVDYSTQISRTLTMPFTVEAAGFTFGSSLWGSATWGSEATQYEFDRLQSVGRGHSVQFVFYFPAATGRWWVDSFTLPYIEKFYR